MRNAARLVLAIAALIALVPSGAPAEAAPATAASATASERIVFPSDPSVLDAKRDLGAKGDGIADDTDALQKGLDASCGLDAKQTKVLFLPNGTYKVTATLVAKAALGPWLYGESRDGTVIRLADGAAGCSSVLRTHPRESGKTSADWFMRNVRNLTIDAGNNPETDGIRWYATNTGILRNVRVIGRGKIGINAGFLDQSGPNLIQDCVVEGFETGILTQWIWGETISRVTLRNCRKEGLVVIANVVGVEDLVVENTPLAVRCDIPKDWTWWGGVIALVGGRSTGGNPDGPAILNKSVLYARNLKTQGFKMAVESTTAGGNVAAADVVEHLSHEAKYLFDAPPRALALPIKPEPRVPWETDPAKWVCVSDFGAVAGDNKDDTAAIQKAIDAAATAGKTTVYLRGVGGPDPNWYTLDGEVRVHGSVRHVLGLGFGRIVAGKGGKFVLGDDAAPVVKFQNIDSFGGPAAVLDQGASPPKLYVDAAGTGDLSAAAPLPAEKSDGSLTFGPVAVATGKEKGAGTVRIRFRSPGSAEYMGALPAGYMAGEVKLGGETYSFAVVDSDFDGRYTPLSSLSVAGASYWRSDMMAIDLDRNGHFRQAPTDTEVMPLAKVLRAKDAYYRVQVAEDGSWVRLDDFEPRMGAIDVGASNLMLVLLSDVGLTTLRGSGGKWQLPEGTYRLAYMSLSQADAKGVKWMTTNPDVDQIEPFRVRAGEMLAMKIGPPLAPAATPDSAQSGLILINLFLVGQAGERYSVGLQKADGVRLPPPKVKILDGSGKVLAEGKAEYG